MAEYTFKLPEFLENQGVEDIHSRMMEALPALLDKGEGGFPWDFTRPTALEKALLVEFVLTNAIKNIVPKFSDSAFLPYHAETRGITRKGEENAKAALTVAGIPGTVIPAGFKVSTEATLDEPGIEFTVDEETEIDATGTAKVPVTAILSGPIGNVSANTIVLQSKPMKGIQSLTNEVAAYGGFEAEDMETLRERILDYDRTQGSSFVGSPSDYRRWAMAVAGVGNAKVIPATDDSGIVTITITDMNGKPGSEELCRNVVNYIMRPDSPMERLAPVNALLNVTPPIVLHVGVAATVELAAGFTIEQAKKGFVEAVNAYFATLDVERGAEVKYTRIGAALLSVPGILDYSSLLVNESESNIEIGVDEMPILDADKVVLTQ